MNTTGPLCVVEHCDYPAHKDTQICTICRDKLTRELAELPSLLEDLYVTLSRQTALGRNGSRSASAALPFDPRASMAAEVLRSTLIGWVRELHDQAEYWPIDTLHAVAVWLYARRHRLLDHPAVEQACDEIGHACALARRATDRPPVRIYAGRCGYLGCDEDLMAKPGRDTVRCRRCGTIHDVGARRDRMLAELDSMLLTASEIARIGAYLGELTGGRERARKLINKWYERGRLVAHGLSRDGVPMFLFGEVVGMLARAQHAAQSQAC